MKIRLRIRSILLVVIALGSSAAAAAPLPVTLTGKLGDAIIGPHAGFGDAPFSGSFEIDLANRLLQPGTGNPLYEMTAWSITVTGSAGSFVLESSGETYDNGTLVFDQSSDLVVLLIDEDIDDPGTLAIEDRSLRMYFNPGVDLTSASTFEGLSTFLFEPSGSLLQFSTSQIPMEVVAGTLTPVPIPAAGWLFGCALPLLGLARRRRS